MRSSRLLPSPASLIWIPLTGVTGAVCVSCYYSYKVVYQMTWYMAQFDGHVWTHPATDQRKAKLVGAAAALGGGAAVFGSFKYILDKILLTPGPTSERRFENAPLGRGHIPLTLSQFRLIGPSATSATLSTFARLHGMQCASIFMAAMWTVMLTPFLHARAEVACAFRGPPKTAEERKAGILRLQQMVDRKRRGEHEPVAAGAAAGVASATDGAETTSDR